MKKFTPPTLEAIRAVTEKVQYQAGEIDTRSNERNNETS